MAAQPPAQRLSGINPLAYLGVEPLSPLEFVIELRDPTQNDNGFNIGTIWLNGLTEDPWMLVNLDQQIATWLRIGGGPGDLEFLTGNTGGMVGPDVSQNINVVADATTGLTITGNPGANTLTLFTTSGGPVGQTLTGDVGGAIPFDAAGNIDIVTIAGAQNAGATVAFIGSGNALRLEVTDNDGNTAVGRDAGSSLTTGTNNTALGGSALTAVTTGSTNDAFGAGAAASLVDGEFNVALGSGALGDATSATFNTAVGTGSGLSLTTGSNNCAVGGFALQNVETGDRNIALGQSAGSSLTGSDSSNIILGNVGTSGDNNTIRIGTHGGGASQQNRCFVAGINGNAVASPASVVIDTVTHQLGIGAAHPSVAGDNAFIATQAPTGGGVLTGGPAGGSAVYSMGTGSVMTVVSDTDGVFFPGDGVGGAATFTAPATGLYHFTWNSLTTATAASSFGVVIYKTCFVINGNTATAWIVNSPSWSVGGDFTDRMGNINSALLSLTGGDVITFLIDFVTTAIGGVDFGGVQSSGGSSVDGQTNWIYGYRMA